MIGWSLVVTRRHRHRVLVAARPGSCPRAARRGERQTSTEDGSSTHARQRDERRRLRAVRVGPAHGGRPQPAPAPRRVRIILARPVASSGGPWAASALRARRLLDRLGAVPPVRPMCVGLADGATPAQAGLVAQMMAVSPGQSWNRPAGDTSVNSAGGRPRSVQAIAEPIGCGEGHGQVAGDDFVGRAHDVGAPGGEADVGAAERRVPPATPRRCRLAGLRDQPR